MTRLLSLAFLVAPSVAAAQTCPVADADLGSATGLVASGVTCGTGADQAGTCGYDSGAEELIYSWTAPSDGTFVVSSNGSAYDTVVYAIGAVSCTEDVCNDDAAGLTSQITLDVVAGDTFFIAVDGYGGSCGAFELRIDTCSGDADADGICDELDLCDGMDWTGDYDSDGICNDLDPCSDSDGDYVCDVFDACEGMDWTGDYDGDGICNDLDPCPDSDGDYVCDVDDQCMGSDWWGDYDSDGICDDLDPCPDSDGDYVCDLYDACEGFDWTGDFDNDGICDDLDPCAPDTDGDGTCDAYDYCVGDDASGDWNGDGTCDDLDPCVPDTDGDGTCDTYDYCNGDDASGDSDFDGVCDDLDFTLEVTRGLSTDPTVLTVHNAPPGAVVTFVSGRHYGPWCPGRNDVVCYSVGTQSGQILSMTRADANGDATFSFVNPDFTDEGLAFQASWTMAGTGDVTNRVLNGNVPTSQPVQDGVYRGPQTTVASTCGTLFDGSTYTFPVALHWTDDHAFVARFPRGALISPLRCTEDAGVLTCDDNRQGVEFMPQAQLLFEYSNALSIVDADTLSAATEATVTCRGTRCAQFEVLFGTTFPCEASLEATYDLRFPL